eukprot:6197732-Pleurochrysis_carterae.AAC.2
MARPARLGGDIRTLYMARPVRLHVSQLFYMAATSETQTSAFCPATAMSTFSSSSHSADDTYPTIPPNRPGSYPTWSTRTLQIYEAPQTDATRYVRSSSPQHAMYRLPYTSLAAIRYSSCPFVDSSNAPCSMER